MSLTNRQRKLLRKLQSRHGRRKADGCLVEGVRCCLEALAHHPEWLRFAVLARSVAESAEAADLMALCPRDRDRFHVIPDDEFAQLALTENPQGVACVMERPGDGPSQPPRDSFVLVLDGVSEPGNLGTILRTAWAVGLHEVWLTHGTTDPYGPKAVRAGMGAQFALAIPVLDSLISVRQTLTESGYETLWCAVPRGGVNCFSDAFQLPRAGLVIGNEAQGISSPELGCPVSIPMPGNAESLNAAQAATVLLVEAVRRGIL